MSKALNVSLNWFMVLWKHLLHTVCLACNAVNSLLMFFIHIFLHCRVMYVCSAGEVTQRSMCLEHGAYHKTYNATHTMGRDFSLFRKP